MTTAKNYAAQAEMFFLNNSSTYRRNKLSPKEIAAIQYIAYSINRSVHFSIPDDAKLLGGKGRTLCVGNLNLPFPSVTIEFYATETNGKAVILATQDTESVVVFPIFGTLINGEWVWVPNATAIKLHGVDEKGILISNHVGFDKISEIFDTDWAGNTKIAARVVVDLIEALSCKNVSTTNIQEEHKGNAKRIHKGKLPLYEIKTLTVNTGNKLVSDGHGGGTHASPRQHLRRGHIRRLPIGNIWVNSCVVGDPTKGVINKNYLVNG